MEVLIFIKHAQIRTIIFKKIWFIQRNGEGSLGMIFAILFMLPSLLYGYKIRESLHATKESFEKSSYALAPNTMNAITTAMIGIASTNATPMNIVV